MKEIMLKFRVVGMACALSGLLILGVPGCGEGGHGSPSNTGDDHSHGSGLGHDDHAPHGGDDHHGHAEHQEENAEGERLVVSPAVQRNLGITFAKVEERAVRQTLRVAGQFELVPSAQRDYHTPVSGRVELDVEQYQEVQEGKVLASIDSPDWRELQASLTQAEAAIETANAAKTVAQVTLSEQEQRVVLLEKRVGRLAEAEVRRVELENELSQSRLALPRLKAELEATRAQARDVEAGLRAKLLIASAKTGLSVDALTATDKTQGGEPVPHWQALNRVPIIAVSGGVAEGLSVTSGRWVETGDELVTVIQPRRLRFHAEALVGDLSRLRSGLPTRLVPSTGGGVGINEGVAGELVVGPTAHAEDRTLELYVTPKQLPAWAKAGVAGFVEVTLNPEAQKQLAIPRSALVQDGLQFVFFKRDANDPQQVQRVVADTGESDGRWIEVLAGVNVGDEVVVDGVYQLLAASSATAQKGGHFHADGTFHEGEDE